MKKKTSLKDLAQLLGFIITVAEAVLIVIDVLGKVVNYGRRIQKFRILIHQPQG